jgi:hypothetical protein
MDIIVMQRKFRADDLVRTAAFLKRELEGRNAALEYLTQNKANRIIYAFDSDIIITRCAPWITGPPREDDNNGYGVIFSAADRDEFDTRETRRAETIASILAISALDLPKKSKLPIFQFPSHAKETNNVYRAVRRTIQNFERFDLRGAELRQTIALNRAIALVRHYASTDAEGEDIHRAIERIVDLLTYRDLTGGRLMRAVREWDAYYALEAEFGGIYPLTSAAAFFSKAPELASAFSVMSPSDRTPQEDDLFKKLLTYWTSQLGRRRRRNIDTDAEALAYLFLVNLRLEDKNARCVLVTGDRELARTAYSGVPTELVPENHASYARSFSVNFVRHLWSYTTDALIERDKRQNFVDLFSGLLAYWSHQLNFPIKMLEDLSNGHLNWPGSPPSKFISDDNVSRTLLEWDALIEKSISDYSLQGVEDKKKLKDAIWAAVRKSMDEGKRWQDLRKVVQEEFHRIRDRTILSMSDLGIDVIIQAERLGRRNPPELVFDSLTNTNEIFRKLGIADSYRDAGSFESDLAKIKEDCWDSKDDGDDRQESHLKFLVLGAAFASAERWLIALNHATRAIAIIDRSRLSGAIPVKHDGSLGLKSHMSGREAYFLAAVAQRMLAASSSDFDTALEYLDRSSGALREDHRHSTASKITSARFDSERLAIALGSYYFARSRDPDDLADALVVDIYKNAKRMVPVFLEWRFEGDPKSLRKVTAVNLATNLLQTFVIAQFRALNGVTDLAECPVSFETVRHALLSVKELTNLESGEKDRKINATRLIRAYALVGSMFLATSSTEVDLFHRRLMHLLQKLEDAVVTHYDEWRYRSLLEFTAERFPLQR